MKTPLLLFLAAYLSWSFAEYTLHRFAFHELKGRGKGSREHLRHHAGLDHTTGTTALSWTGVFVVGIFGFGPIGWALGGVAGGVAAAVGWISGFYTYEYLHWSAHNRPPRGRYTRWLRRHHFQHHFSTPLLNQGVTTPLWDHVFGTYSQPERIRVPRRMAVSSVSWLLDEQGELRPEFVADYEVVGAAHRDDAGLERDRRDAFANVAPSS